MTLAARQPLFVQASPTLFKSTGITFQHCSNAISNGGALSTVNSSVTVSQCGFFNSHWELQRSQWWRGGRGRALFLIVQNLEALSDSRQAIGQASHVRLGAGRLLLLRFRTSLSLAAL
jgi:hypothetical protein